MTCSFAHGWVPAEMSDVAVRIFDNALPPTAHKALLEFLSLPAWGFGAFSSISLGAPRYWYKHFSGISQDSIELNDRQRFETQLRTTAPLVADFWHNLRGGILSGHSLLRCYANAYPYGSEGGVHLDSNLTNHYTAIYYPNLVWHPDFAGETVFFNEDRSDIIASIYPKPNRLIIFKGTTPHSARAVSRVCTQLRITLMFKTVK